MNTTLYAFVGRRGSGKDTASNLLYNIIEEEQIEGISASFAFADSLKQMAHRSLDITTPQSEFLKRNPNIKIANNQDLRTYYNNFGDVLKSNFGDDIFRQKTIQEIQDAIDNFDINFITITDVRYPEEIIILKEFCSLNNIELISIKLINIRNPDIDNSHESESQIDSIETDFTIEAKNVQEIKTQMEKIYNELHTTTA